MWSLVFRLALLASSLIVAWNFARIWIGALGAPKKAPELPAPSHADIAARALAEEATRHVTAIEVAIAHLSDQELWDATAGFTAAVNRLEAALLAEPSNYRRAKRHLGQILIATEQMAKHFARHYAATPNPGTRRQFLDLMRALTEAYGRATTSYAEAGATALEVEAETLKELLRRYR
ncbi:MAG: hypothetical protein HKN98_17580 [Silicimonas sp.]|nr:hypothetical protein [Silicimonas sp.]NND43256.1 hypothetical protein [Silicimonas sp.]NNF92830.1 hypothetical protein [Boseongicola sp.]NNL34961.1 hypothetical protein [Silicimonas sp.]